LDVRRSGDDQQGQIDEGNQNGEHGDVGIKVLMENENIHREDDKGNGKHRVVVIEGHNIMILHFRRDATKKKSAVIRAFAFSLSQIIR
jgi:hypothetical protein